MDYTVPAVIDGKDRLLNYSVEVMFRVVEKYGGVNQALDAIEKDTREAFEHLRWLAVELANDGELCRRMQGLEAHELLKAEEITTRMAPYDYVLLKGKVVEAIYAGYHRETESEEEVDLGLAEINEKKAPAGA